MQAADQHYQVLGRGANRLCVIHPDDPSVCLKINLPRGEIKVKSLRHRLRLWLSSFFLFMDSNVIEYAAYQRLRRRNIDKLDTYVAPCLYLEKGDRGWTLACECVYDGDGLLAKSLASHLHKGSAIGRDALLRALDEFQQWLVGNNIPLFDLNANNILVVRHEGEVSVKCIDVKSVKTSKELLPVSRLSKKLLRRKLHRRMARLKKQVEKGVR